LKRVAELRDRIWAAAVALYQSDYEWWLNQNEEAIAAEFTEAYRTEDPWIAPVSSYLRENSRGEVTTAELLKHALEIETGRQGKREEIRVADILKGLGWTAERRTISGKRRRVWVEPDDRGCPNPLEVVPQVETPTQQGSQQDSASVQSGQPGQPPKQVVPRVAPPEITVGSEFQKHGTNWTTSNPKTNSFSQNGKPQSNGHSPPAEIEPMSDRELAELMGGEPR
jgi:predicted P-loop ATPase